MFSFSAELRSLQYLKPQFSGLWGTRQFIWLPCEGVAIFKPWSFINVVYYSAPSFSQQAIIWGKHTRASPLGKAADCHPSDCIQPDLFTQWFRRFLCGVKPRKEDTVVPILHGHCFHSRVVKAIDLTSENGMPLLFLSPHSTDHMQLVMLCLWSPSRLVRLRI